MTRRKIIPLKTCAPRAGYACAGFDNVGETRGAGSGEHGAPQPAGREPRVTRRAGGSRHLQPYGHGSFGQAKLSARAGLAPASGSTLIAGRLALLAG